MADGMIGIRLENVSARAGGRRILASACLFATFIAFAFSFAALDDARATNVNNAYGKWSRPFQLASTPVHFVIGPCDSSQPSAPRDTFHSQIMWFAGSNTVHPYGGLLFWKNPTTASDGFSDDTLTAFPEGNIYSRLISAAARNAFCGGMSRLGSGNVFISGGTEAGSDEVGITDNTVFAMATRTWDTSVDPITMANRRWYSTATTLPSGRALVTSGSIYRHLHFFGGTYDNDTTVQAVPNVITRLGLSAKGDWDGQVSDPSADSSGDTLHLPRPREFHTCTAAPSNACDMYFGGRFLNGTYDRALNDVYWAYRGEPVSESDYRYTWVRLSVGGTAPDPRYLHAANADSINNLVVFGGAVDMPGGSYRAFNDLWVVHASGGPPATYTWFKARQDTFAIHPGHRCGDAMFKDEETQTFYVFGGSTDPDAAPSDSTVYSLKLSFNGTFYSATWDTLHVVGASPPPLTKFAYAMDTSPRLFGHTGTTPKFNRRAFVFGGRDNSGNLSSDLWQLWFVKDSSAAGVHGLWQKITASGNAPSARMNAAMAIEANFDRLVVCGGDTTLGRARNGASRAMIVDEVYPGSSGTPTWTVFGSTGTSPLKKFSGATLHEWGNECFARVPEIYDPAPGASPKVTADASDYHLSDWYPQMFVLPDTATTHQLVFEAGPRKDSWLFDVDGTAGSRWQPVDTTIPTTTAFRGGTSVLYRVGGTDRVLKVGSRDTDGPDRRDAVDTTMSINLGGSPSTYRSLVRWQVESPMRYRRVNHNLALLPTGDVLVVGGTRQLGNDIEGNSGWQSMPYNYTPEVWHLVSGAMRWDTLLADPFHYPRGYHSSAVLLPDSRVLIGGGNTIYDSTSIKLCNSVQIFSPPYLFGSNEKLLPRPQYITGGGPASYFGGFETFVFDTTVDSLVMIRGTATTHAFNMEQRRIPMFRDNSSRSDTNLTGYHEFTVAMPTDSALAPPGDYMVFALKAGYAPSIARWIRIAASLGYDPNDMLRPGRPEWSSDQSTDCPFTHAFEWTAPADDSTYAISGKVGGYVVKYATGSTSPCNTCWSTFNSSMTTYVDGPLTGAAPGSPESFTASGLTVGLTYKFQALSYDDRRPSPYQTSRLSTVVTFHENGCEEDLMAGGGDGGGLSARRADPRGSVAAGRTAATVTENTVLDGIGNSESRSELLPLPTGPQSVNGALRVHLRRGKQGRNVVLGGVQLVGVDVSANGGTPVLTDRRLLAGQVLAVTSVMRAGTQMLSQLTGSDSNPLHGIAGDTLLATLPQPEGVSIDTPLPVVIRAGGVPTADAGSNSGILVQVPNGTGGWRTLGRDVPHAQFSTFGTDSVAGTVLRLVLLSDLDISSVGRLVPGSGSVTQISPQLAGVHHSRLGDLGANSLSLGGSGVAMAAQDTLLLDFADVAAADTVTRTWYLKVTGTGGGTGAADARAQRVAAIPTAFSLGQNRPNPFTGATLISFGLPRASHVQLEVFDLLGRRVRTLADRQFEAGFQEVAWDRRSSSGDAVHAGVYFYRMTAGTFRADRKMIISP